MGYTLPTLDYRKTSGELIGKNQYLFMCSSLRRNKKSPRHSVGHLISFAGSSVACLSSIWHLGTSLVVQGLRLHLPKQ